MKLDNCDFDQFDFNPETLKNVCRRIGHAGRSFLARVPGSADAKPSIAWPDYVDSLAYIKNGLMELGRAPVLFSPEKEEAVVNFYLNKSGVKEDLWEEAQFLFIPVPCTYGGNLFSLDQIGDESFITLLIVDKAGNTLRGFGTGSSQIFSALPVEIRDSLVVEIGRYEQENPAPHLLSAEDKKMIETAIREAFRRGRAKFDV